MNRIDFLIFDFRNRHRYYHNEYDNLNLCNYAKEGQDLNEKTDDILQRLNEKSKDRNYLINFKFSDKQTVRILQVCGLVILISLFITFSFSFADILTDFLARELETRFLVTGYPPAIQIIFDTYLVLYLFVGGGVIPAFLLAVCYKILRDRRRHSIKIRKNFLRDKSYLIILAEKYNISIDFLRKRMEFRLSLKNKPDGSNFFVAVVALAISIFAAFNDVFLQWVSASLYDWRLIFWMILFITGFSFIISCKLYFKLRSEYNEEAYMLSILEEIEYCDK